MQPTVRTYKNDVRNACLQISIGCKGLRGSRQYRLQICKRAKDLSPATYNNPNSNGLSLFEKSLGRNVEIGPTMGGEDFRIQFAGPPIPGGFSIGAVEPAKKLRTKKERHNVASLHRANSRPVPEPTLPGDYRMTSAVWS
jgi:hypothetical protein